MNRYLITDTNNRVYTLRAESALAAVERGHFLATTAAADPMTPAAVVDVRHLLPRTSENPLLALAAAPPWKTYRPRDERRSGHDRRESDYPPVDHGEPCGYCGALDREPGYLGQPRITFCAYCGNSPRRGPKGW